jgi:hypothetical protein
MQKSTQILRIYVSPNSRFKGRPNIEGLLGCWDDTEGYALKLKVGNSIQITAR